jgi:hypothetical protein
MKGEGFRDDAPSAISDYPGGQTGCYECKCPGAMVVMARACVAPPG